MFWLCAVDVEWLSDGEHKKQTMHKHIFECDHDHKLAGKLTGFTMIEFLMVILIVSILSTVAFPAFTQFINTEKLEAATDQLAQTFVTARSTAIKSGLPVIMCASEDEVSCSGTWDDGWLVYIDEDRDNSPGTDDDIVVRSSNASDSTTFDIKTTAGADISSVSFNFRGAPSSTLDIIISRGDLDSEMMISPFGKPIR